MLVAKYYLEGKDVRMNDVNGSVRLEPASGPLDTFDGEGERSPQVHFCKFSVQTLQDAARSTSGCHLHDGRLRVTHARGKGHVQEHDWSQLG